jgi:hypothetical protein
LQKILHKTAGRLKALSFSLTIKVTSLQEVKERESGQISQFLVLPLQKACAGCKMHMDTFWSCLCSPPDVYLELQSIS